MSEQVPSDSMGTYWLPKGTKVICNGVEIVLDGETNSILAKDADWPELQRAFFPEDEWDDFPEEERP